MMIGVDWGSSGFRAYLLHDDGRIAETRSAACGITTLRQADYPAVLQREIGDWLQDDGNRPILLSGMVGSRQGWREAAYVECPAGLADLPRHLCPVGIDGERQALIVPGLVCRTAAGLPDVMRGEETQIFGIVEAGETASLCLPGTHSKHVAVEAGRITGFATAMTGEVFALLRRHGLLAAMLPPDAAGFDPAAFRSGVARSGDSGGLLHHFFGVRTRRLFDELAAAAALDYLSGIMIGHEIRGTTWTGSVRIVGAHDLSERYRLAFECLGIAASVVPEHAAAQGLHRIGRLLAGGRP
ncbi:MAG TPA: 2-dehydro-3-deoxygalactonokinase [Ferrovibrio sp.]|uniref:2-dehydro-3-deoxygalactonokinase n=1 Tax=Ferrovibrio sp. TaxID=1917215 RepID=UPI002ED4D4C6